MPLVTNYTFGWDFSWGGLTVSWYKDHEYIQLKIGYLR